MFGWSEVVLILILALILLGPDKLAEVARTIGRIYGEYQKAKKRLELELIYGKLPSDEEVMRIWDRRVEEIRRDVREALNRDEVRYLR